MLRKICSNLICLVFLLNYVSHAAFTSELDDLATVAELLYTHSSGISIKQVQVVGIKSPISHTGKETLSISYSISFDTADDLIAHEEWRDDVYLRGLFNEMYDKLKLDSLRQVSFKPIKGVFFNDEFFEIKKESLMQYCREEYEKKSLPMEIIADNRKVSEFVSAVLSGATYDLATFLDVTDCSAVFGTLNAKMNSEQVLSGEKENLTLAELSRPERRLMLTLFMLNKLSQSGNSSVATALQTVKSLSASIDFADFVKGCCDLNPYYSSIQRVGVTGLSFSDYDRFFNYESLSDISTVLHILSHLNSTTTFGSIGVIIDNLKSFIGDFVSSGFDKENPELFAKFVDLQSKFPSME